MTGAEPGTPASAVRAIAEELAHAGVRDVVICPGSRSTPITLAVAAHPDLRTWVHLDERAGAFFALGAAIASRRPSAIVVTSGTAGVELAPAIVEAHEARVPLVVLTADRPPELRDRGANQTIDQLHLYGRFVRWFAELPVPDGSPRLERHLRNVVGRAVGTATEAPAGPVHLDLPFREPLVPAGSLEPEPGDGRAFTELVAGRRTLPEARLAALAGRLASAQRPLIVCGPLDVPAAPDAIARLAAALAAPILADALSNMRLGPHDRSHVIGHPDALARAPALTEGLTPDVVLRLGATPTSKALVALLERDGAEHIVVDDGGWREATLRPATVVHAEPAAFAAGLADAIGAGATRAPDATWLARWRAADAAAAGAIADAIGALDEPFEGAVFHGLPGRLPAGTILFAGNSMPVRDLDAFLPGAATDVRCLASRGASGIDGLVSTALGMAAVHAGPVVAVVGDLSFLHDLGALASLRGERPPLTVVLVDNDGGGIFSFLPQATAEAPEAGLPARFERLFGTPHGLDLGGLARALGARVTDVGPSQAAIGRAIEAAVSRPGVDVLHLRTGRARNVELHRSIARAASEAVRAALAGTPTVGSAAR